MPPIKRSPTPIYNREGVTIYHDKCEDVLPTLRPNSFDALITDPPFGIGFRYNEHDDSPEGYGKWLWSVIEQAESKLKPGSPVFVWQAMLNCRHFSEWFPRDYRIFAGVKNYVAMYPSVAMQFCWDPVIVWWTQGKKYIPTDNYRARDFQVARTSTNGSNTHKFEDGHPCPRPLDQCQYLMQWVPRGGVVLDLFLGSGTTAVAASNWQRKCVGIEKDKKYVDIAVNRIEDVKSGGFVAAMRKQQQKLGRLKRGRDK